MTIIEAIRTKATAREKAAKTFDEAAEALYVTAVDAMGRDWTERNWDILQSN